MILSTLLALVPFPSSAQFTDMEILQFEPRELRGLQTVDLDQDGDQDIIGGASDGGSIAVWEGDGTGSFNDTRMIGIGVPAIFDLDVGDVDGDGDLDFVGITNGPTLFWSENDGAGEYIVARPLFSDATYPSDATMTFALGDVDGDGQLDVIASIAHPSMAARLMRVDAVGTSFPTAEQIAVPVFGPAFLKFGDIDGDGDGDLAYAGGGGGGIGGGVEVALALNDGAGGFTLKPSLPPVAPFGPNVFARFLGIYDENNDGVQDIVLAYLIQPSIIPMFPPAPFSAEVNISSFRAVAPGSFVSPTQVYSSQFTPRVNVFDLDGDQDQDIFLASGASISTLENLTGGNYGAETVLATAIPVILTTAGDFNGDNQNELVSVTRAGQVLIHELVPGSPVLAVSPNATLMNDVVVAPKDPSLLDFDGDGHLDVVVRHRHERPFQVWPGDGMGGFGAPIVPGASTIFGLPLNESIEEGGKWADIDADGDLDFVAVAQLSDGIGWLENLGAGQFASFELIVAQGRRVHEVQIADMDDDGLLDVIRVNRWGLRVGWYKNLGSGAFGPWAFAPIGSADAEIVIEDLDGDGDLDFVVGGRFGNMEGVQFHENDGAGGFEPAVLLATFPTDVVMRDFRLADVNQDGLLDIVRLGYWISPVGRGRLQVALGVGGLAYGSPVDVDLHPAESPSDLEVVDVDGDGQLDVVTLAQNTPPSAQSNGFTLLRGRGDGSFEAGASMNDFGDLPMSGLLRGDLGDIDGDGDLDLLVVDPDLNIIGWHESVARGDVGVPFCEGAVPNSVGLSSRTRAYGSARIVEADLQLAAADLPPGVLGIFITGTATISAPLASSVGILCVGGSLGRFVGPGQVVQADPAGRFGISIDLGQLPGPGVFSSVAPGETRYFQAWHRDVVGSQATSNLTDAVAVTAY